MDIKLGTKLGKTGASKSVNHIGVHKVPEYRCFS